MASLRAASGANFLAATSVTLTKPTGAASGDWVGFGVDLGFPTETLTVSSGWTMIEQTACSTFHFSVLVYRVLDGGASDANPTLSWTTSGRGAYTGIAFTPAASTSLSIDVEATVVVATTGATTGTPNAATPTTSAPVSIIWGQGRANVNAATAITATPPTNWTEPTNGDQSTASGTGARQVASEVSYRIPGSSATLTPGAITFSGAVTQLLHHIILKESVATTPVGDTLQLIWDARAAVGDTLQAVWDVRSRLGDTLQLVWDIRTPVADQLQLVWDVRSRLGDTLQLSWDVRQALGRPLSVLWDVQAALTAIGKPLQLIWDVRQAVGDPLALLWDVRTAQGDTLALVWNVRQATGKSLQLSWDARQALGDQLSLLWDIRQRSSRDLALLWNVRVAQGDALQLIWDTQSSITVLTRVPDLIYSHGRLHLLVDEFLAIEL